MELQHEDGARFALIADDGRFPNSRLPLVVCPGALSGFAGDLAAEFERVFAANGWLPAWRSGIFGYHHYHSTAHEGLGVSRGFIVVLLGGDEGLSVRAEAGDCIVIPAGVAHTRIEASTNLLIVGAYPKGQSPDMLYGAPGERPAADRNIAAVPLPSLDPVAGKDGPLVRLWRSAPAGR